MAGIKESDHYRSDEWIWAIFDGWHDPCPYRSDDLLGLIEPWGSQTFVNPPYSNPLPWVEKAILERERGNTVVLLLKHDSSTKWFRLLHEAGAHFLLVSGRLKYQTGKPANFPSVLAVLS